MCLLIPVITHRTGADMELNGMKIKVNKVFHSKEVYV